MSKRIISLIITILILLSFVSCSSSNKGFSRLDILESTVNKETNTESSTESKHETEQYQDATEIVTESETTNNNVSGDSSKSFHLLACPDNIIHPSVYYGAILTAANKAGVNPVYYPIESATFDFSNIYRYVADEIKSADLSYINVETMIGGNENGISGYPQFNSPEAIGDYLCDLGFDVYNVAHNHMLDSGNDKYLINCYNFFKNKGKSVIGYYKNYVDTNNIVVTEVNGIKVAWLAYTYATNGIVLYNSETYIPYFDDDLIKYQVALAKQCADVVFVSAHWGNENNYKINSSQEHYANLFTSLDVDAVIGMHPHCIQPMEWTYNQTTNHKTLMIYSLGNFVSGMLESLNMLGGMLSMDVVKNNDGSVSLNNVLFEPVVTHYTKVPILDQTDTGYRNHTIYYLKDYTNELASQHYVSIYEKSNGYTLVGGAFNKENLIATVQNYIPAEFLEEAYR